MKAFKPYCYISNEADSLTASFSDTAGYSEVLSDQITVYRSLETNEIVGCRIDGLSKIDKLPAINTETVRASMEAYRAGRWQYLDEVIEELELKIKGEKENEIHKKV